MENTATAETYELSLTDEGDVEILVSTGYGAGWSTWNGYDIRLATDKQIIDYFKAHLNEDGDFDSDIPNEELEAFFLTLPWIPKDLQLYFGGFYDCVIKKVPRGQLFRIDEYDGAESIEYFIPKTWICF